jgi:hypothetical protein
MEKLCVQERPNGKVYRARKGPTLHAYFGEWPENECVMILRISEEDESVARKMAEDAKKQYGYEMIGGGWFGWWRDSIRNGEQYWDYDSVNGVPGWYYTVE